MGVAAAIASGGVLVAVGAPLVNVTSSNQTVPELYDDFRCIWT